MQQTSKPESFAKNRSSLDQPGGWYVEERIFAKLSGLDVC